MKKPKLLDQKSKMMNDTTSQHNAAMYQNNSAVALISAGHYDAAMSCLSNALKTYKQLMNTNDDETPQTKMASLDHCMAQSSAAAQGNHLATHEDKSGRYIYRQAIRIPQDMQCDCRANVMVCVVVIFNLALAHHLAAGTGGETKQHRLRKAVKLYELAFQLLQQEEHLENNAMFTMAALNNMGLAHQQLNDEESASNCFQHLLSALMCLVDCGQVNVCGELDGFLRNVSGVICTQVTAPAA
jgi:tetratricopeptide (TPR) repeat protein